MIIFLDFDGVLVNRRSYHLPHVEIPNSRKVRQADPDCIAELNRITDITGAEIVVSSTWRADGMTRMVEVLHAWGVTGRIAGKTPRRAGQPRGTEIAEYLDLRGDGSRFVILDDDSDMAHLADYLVKTEFETGLTSLLASRAISILSQLP